MEKHHIPYHEKKLSQLFCDGTSGEIVRMLLAECETAGVTIRLNCKVTGIYQKNGFSIGTNLGVVVSESLVMATGGPSIPQMGATSFTQEVARQFGLKVTPVRPGLVPFTFNGPALDFCRGLAGLSIPCRVVCNGASFEENLLFTHRGISGPAILQISSYWSPGESIRVDLLPNFDLAAHLQEQQVSRPKAELATILSSLLPRNFVKAMCETTLPNRPINGLSLKEQGVYCRDAEGLDHLASRDRRLPQGGGRAGRGGHHRSFIEDDGSGEGTRPVLHRRSGGRDGPPWWL